MNRAKAFEISDALTKHGISHTIAVGVQDGYIPRERYSVNVTPLLLYLPTDIAALQRLAEELECTIALVAGSFAFRVNQT